jgi:hypothetical protein
VKALERSAEAGQAAQNETAKTQALAKLEASRAKLEAAKLEAQSKAEASIKAEEELRTATTATAQAHDASEEAGQDLSPVSVFISRKTQRLYIRRNNMPVYEGPVTIRNADKRIGSFVFTAIDNGATPGTMRWSVVSMYKNATVSEPPAPAAKGNVKPRPAEAVPADVEAAKAALARLVVTDEAKEHISAGVLPGSSLIVSDEGPSGETGKDTDFIVVMSDEPQGGLTSRHHPSHEGGDVFEADSFFGRFTSTRRSWGHGGGGGFPFFSD